MSRRAQVMRGVAWNAAFQVAQAVLSLGAMFVLARLVPPAEYGRVTATLGVLGLVNAFNCGVFVAQALQLPDGQEPDWSLHFGFALRLQLGLCLLLNGIAGIGWCVATWRPIAPLLHVAAFGLLVDWPGQVRQAMLRRQMGFARLRLLGVLALAANLATAMACAFAGRAGLGLVLGANLVQAVPFGLDLFVAGWRPSRGWWRAASWRPYRAALRFGVQQGLSGALTAGKGVAASLLLPATLGFYAMGLISRAQALYLQTAARGSGILSETVYPLLPRFAADAGRYREVASIFVGVVAAIVLPAAAFLYVAGPLASRCLYGQRWIAADPMIAPSTLAGLLLSLTAAFSLVLLALNRLRACLVIEVVAFTAALPAVAATWLHREPQLYLWSLVAAQAVALLIALRFALTVAPLSVWSSLLLPALVAALAAAGAVTLAEGTLPGAEGAAWRWLRCIGLAAGHGLVYLLTLRLLFPGTLARLIRPVIGERRAAWLGLGPRSGAHG